MGELVKLVVVLGVFFLVIGLAWVVAWKLGLLKSRPREGAERLPYRKCEGVLSPAELAFYLRLVEAMPLLGQALGVSRPPVVFAKVRLADIFEVDLARGRDRSKWQSAFNRVGSKHADFVLCNPVTTEPVLVIELDDKSHEREERRERDGFVDRVCEAAGVAILHVKAAGRYEAGEIARRCGEKLGR